MGFRLAIGGCDCRKPYGNPIQQMACEAIDARLLEWRASLPGDLGSVPTEHYEVERVEGHWVTFGTFKRPLDENRTLVVCSALVHTWSRPTFISIGAVGRMYAEGLIISSLGDVSPAPDELMWVFR
jgi:hypothetical protein